MWIFAIPALRRVFVFCFGSFLVCFVQVFFLFKVQNDLGHSGIVGWHVVLWMNDNDVVLERVLMMFLCPPLQFGSHDMSDGNGHSWRLHLLLWSLLPKPGSATFNLHSCLGTVEVCTVLKKHFFFSWIHWSARKPSQAADLNGSQMTVSKRLCQMLTEKWTNAEMRRLRAVGWTALVILETRCSSSVVSFVSHRCCVSKSWKNLPFFGRLPVFGELFFPCCDVSCVPRAERLSAEPNAKSWDYSRTRTCWRTHLSMPTLSALMS